MRRVLQARTHHRPRVDGQGARRSRTRLHDRKPIDRESARWRTRSRRSTRARLASWIDDFSRDHDLDREIAVDEAIAAAYAAYVTRRAPDLPARREAYQLLLLRSGAPEAEVLTHITLARLTPDQAYELMQAYAAPSQPVEIQ